MTESSLLQEIEEDMQRRKLEALWKRFSLHIIGLALAIVLGTAGYTYWHNQKMEQEQRATGELLKILDASNPDRNHETEALKKFATDFKSTNQAMLAQLQQAELLSKDGKADQAITVYDAVANDTSVEPTFRQLADLLSVEAQLDSGDPKQLLARLQPLMADDAPWFYSAKEYAAHIALRAGDKAEAIKLFTELSQDAGTSPTMSLRVSDMLHWLKQGN